MSFRLCHSIALLKVLRGNLLPASAVGEDLVAMDTRRSHHSPVTTPYQASGARRAAVMGPRWATWAEQSKALSGSELLQSSLGSWRDWPWARAEGVALQCWFKA